MANTAPVVLDLQEGISLNIESPPFTNIHALFYIPDGLHALALTIRRKELELNRTGLAFGMGESVAGGITYCAFHWFAISLTNYLRLVRLVDLMAKKSWRGEDLKLESNRKVIRETCRGYVQSVVPEILTWRNKVAAHFAATDPFDDDNIATLQASVMNLVGYLRPFLRTNAMVWNTNNEKATIPQWALTETFERLSPRFWPGRRLPLLPSG